MRRYGIIYGQGVPSGASPWPYSPPRKRSSALANGGITLSIGPSINLDKRYTWARKEDFYAYILRTVPRTQPFEIAVPEEELDLWNRLCAETDAVYNQRQS